MKLAVIGAGVVGVTTAYELSRDGHEVTVFERCSTAAEEASFANGGLLAPEWAGALASERESHDRSTGATPWWKTFQRNARRQTSDPGPAVVTLARYSVECLDGLCESLQLTPNSHQGMMIVWKNPRDTSRAEKLQAIVRALSGESHFMSAEQARGLEFALNPETALHGTLVMPQAWAVNCRQFTLQLRARAQQNRCRFEFGSPITRLQTGQGVQLTRQGGQTERFDAVVLCTGSASDALLKAANVRIPLETWTGHSLSAAVREPLDAPVAVVHDLRHNVSIVRMGLRIRVSGAPGRVDNRDGAGRAFQRLYAVLDDWFPGAIRHGQAGGIQEWTASVAATPDTLPVIGSTGADGVWINAGHGAHGWVMACGSARLLADQLACRETEIEAGPYRAARWAE